MTTENLNGGAPGAATGEDPNLNPHPGVAPVDDGGQPGGAAKPAAPAPSWRDGLDADIKDHPSLTNFKEPKDLAKSWVNAQKLIGKDKIPLPGKNATPAEWDEVYNRLGRPQSPEGYKIPEDYAAPELTSPEGREAYKSIAHKLGLLPQQAEGLYKWWADQANGGLAQSNEQRAAIQKETETKLRKEFGFAYEQKINDAKKVLLQFNSKEEAEYLEANFGNDPTLIKFLIRMGGKMSEDGIVGKGESNFLSPDEAKAEIAKIRANPVYLQEGNPEQKLLVQRMRQLHTMAYGQQ